MNNVFDNVQPLSEKLKKSIPPLGDGEVAVFRLKNAFRIEAGREEPSSPEIVQLSPRQTITDPFEVVGSDKKGEPVYGKVTKVIGTYIKDYKTVGGNVKPIYAAPEFFKGELRLTSGDQAMYEYLMRSLDNETNKYRKQMGAKKAPRFFLVGTKEVTPFMQMADMKYYAEKLVRESSFQYLREMATKLNTSPDARLHIKSFNAGFTSLNDPEKIKYELIQKAHDYPKQIMAATPDQKIMLRVQIYDAQVYGVLMFEKGEYVVDTDAKFVTLFKPAPDSEKDKIDGLIDFLMSEEGKDSYLLFAKTLKNALAVTKTERAA